MRCFDVVQQRYLQKGIADVLVIEARGRFVQLAQQRVARRLLRLWRQGPSRLDHESAAALVENSLVGVPGAVNGDPTMKLIELVEPFEYRRIRIRSELIAVDGIVRVTRGHFVVAWIRKRL